ncbi:MAG: 30S ribosomal protein S20 [Oscillospiraceae bacterium]|nr:30S ribosomal protein S20 [Oscillospiraceae bacterium]MBR2781891.1 30S ribosomal protein S20 [Oscillospiraceae bacterium]
MPNIKSAKKRVLVSKANAERNKMYKSELKTVIKKFTAAYESGNQEEAKNAAQVAVKTIDQAVNKGILHKNTAARKKSSIALKMNKLA